MIIEDYVSFETAKLLKEKGFNEPCECLYDTENNDKSIVNGWMDVSNSELEERGLVRYSAPTLQMAMRWLREVHKIGVFPSPYSIIHGDDVAHVYDATIINLNTYELMTNDYFERDSYEEAAEAGIKYCLENLI